MKISAGETGRGMLRGEYEGVSKLHEVIPQGVPDPVAGAHTKHRRILTFTCATSWT